MRAITPKAPSLVKRLAGNAGAIRELQVTGAVAPSSGGGGTPTLIESTSGTVTAIAETLIAGAGPIVAIEAVDSGAGAVMELTLGGIQAVMGSGAARTLLGNHDGVTETAEFSSFLSFGPYTFYSAFLPLDGTPSGTSFTFPSQSFFNDATYVAGSLNSYFAMGAVNGPVGVPIVVSFDYALPGSGPGVVITPTLTAVGGAAFDGVTDVRLGIFAFCGPVT